MNVEASTKRELQFDNFSYIFGRCHRLLRKRWHTTQSLSDAGIQDALGKKNNIRYTCLIENHKYSGNDEEAVINAMVKRAKKQYDKIRDYYSAPDLNPPDWLDVISDSGWDTNKINKVLNDWYDKEMLLESSQDVIFETNWRYCMFWYSICVKYIIGKYEYSIKEFSEFAGIPYNQCWRLLSLAYGDTKNASKILYDITFGIEKLFKRDGKEVPKWIDYIYGRNYKKAVKYMKEWFILALDIEAKSGSEV